MVKYSSDVMLTVAAKFNYFLEFTGIDHIEAGPVPFRLGIGQESAMLGRSHNQFLSCCHCKLYGNR